MNNTYYALRRIGSRDWVTRLPHDFEPENFAPSCEAPGVLRFETEDAAFEAQESDPDGNCLMIEPCGSALEAQFDRVEEGEAF